MVFSSVPLFQLDPPNWQQHLPGRVYDDDDNNNSSHPPPPMPPDHGVSIRPSSMAERARLTKLQQQETAHKCPRCASTNTKFCYYNNYSLSQPRHFCKTCRRYWTRGGALRNVPVGGGFRRNKRSKRSRSKSPVTAGNSPTSSCTTDNIVGHVPPSILPQFPLLPSINSITDLGAEDINRFSFRGIINQPPTTTAGGYSDQWRMQEYPFLCQFQSEGVKEFTSQYGIKTVDFCGPSQTDILVKIEENQGLMSFPGNDQQYWSNGNAWNQII